MPRSPELTSEERTARIHVAAGILRDADRVLLSERIGDSAFAGLWEFPGGKLDDGETPDVALERELAEELGVTVTAYSHLLQVSHQYADRSVVIDFFIVDGWLGEPESREGQALKWSAITALDASTVLPADEPVIRVLKESCG